MIRRRSAGTGPTKQVAPAPSVDLLSPWVLEERRAHVLRTRFGYATLVLVALLAMAWSTQQLRLTGVGRQLDAEVAAGERIGGRIEALGPVESYTGSVSRRAELIRATMHAEVSTSRVLAALQAALPPGARFDSVSLELAPAPGTAGGEAAPPGGGSDEQPAATDRSARGVSATCPGPDPFRSLTVVGCVALVGTAPDRAQIAALVRRLADDQLFVEPFVSTTTVSEDSPLTFTGTVGLTPASFTRRYDEVAELLPAAVSEAGS